MRFPCALLLHLLWLCSAGVALGQQPAATPKKDSFSDFGRTSLDKRPAGQATPSPFDKSPSAQPAFAPETGSQTGSGIVLAGNWQGHTAESSGGQTMKLADLRALLTNFGKPEADIEAHPDVTVYEGQRMDGKPGDNCRVTYLMPLMQDEAQLFHSRGMTTASRAVAPGLPDGLFLHTYDIHAGIYNRLIIVTDSAKPEPQVVTLILKGEGVNYYPGAPFRKVERDWHTFDYVNTENRGQSGVKIDTRVHGILPWPSFENGLHRKVNQESFDSSAGCRRARAGSSRSPFLYCMATGEPAGTAVSRRSARSYRTVLT